MTIGKLTNLMRLADAAGRFKMLAIDQRDSLRAALGKAAGRAPADITPADLAAVKDLITEVLSPYSTATLVDPIYGLPRAVTLIPGDVGILLASETTGYERPSDGSKERIGKLIDGWSVAKTKRAGANAVKLLIHYSPEASGEVLVQQQRLVQRVGEECRREDIPFLLELVTYPIAEPSADAPEFARNRPQHAVESAREFSQDRYHVDVLKLEFPGDLKYSRQFHQAVFDEKERPALYDVDEVRGFCRALDAAAGRPWVILSGGVGIKEFLVNLELAADAGASGFLCGRAIWKDAVPAYPDLGRMRGILTTDGIANFVRANAAAERARPWFLHPHIGGWDRLKAARLAEEWYRDYGNT